MGNSNTIINITFDRSQPVIYYTGDTISGQVNFTIAERTTTVEYIFLMLTGDVGHTTTHTTRMQSGVTKRTTDYHDIRILGEKIILGHAYIADGQDPNNNNRKTDTTILEPGRYSYPFSICLPNILPPTLHPKDYPFVRYQLQLFIEKKWYCSNVHSNYPLRIHPRVNLIHMENSQCTVKFDKTYKDIIVQGVIQRSGLIPGEQTIIHLKIHNPQQLVIKHVHVCLIQHYSIEENRRRLELIRSSIPQLTNVYDEYIETTCSIIIPKGTPPTYNYRGRAGRSLVHVNIQYDIKLEIKTKRLFSDYDLQIPIIIGTDSNSTNTTLSSIDLENIDTINDEIDDDDDDRSVKSQITNC